MKNLFAIIFCLGLVCCCTSVWAQKYPERRNIRSGNKAYENGNYPEAEVSYRRALEKNPESEEASFNLSNSLYKQERFEEAGQIAAQIATDSTSNEHKAAAFYNQGNALFKQKKLEEALEAYKNSLRLNPDDMDAKFNYALTKKLLEKDKNGGGGNNDQNQQNNQNQQNQQNQNQDKQDNQNNQNNDNKQNDSQNDQQNQQNQNNNPNQQDQQQNSGGMSKEEADRMLEAMQSNEDNTKKKLDEQKVKAVGRSGKNW